MALGFEPLVDMEEGGAGVLRSADLRVFPWWVRSE